MRLGSLPVSCGLLIDLWAFDPIGKSQGIPLYVYTWENTLYIYFCHQNLGYPGAAPDSRYIHLNGIRIFYFSAHFFKNIYKQTPGGLIFVYGH